MGDSTEMAAPADVTAPSERIYLLRCSSAPSGGGATERARKMLLNGPELHPCREALAAAGFEFLAPGGAMLAVKPQHYHDVRRALVSFELHPFHIIVAESLEYLIEETLAKLP